MIRQDAGVSNSSSSSSSKGSNKLYNRKKTRSKKKNTEGKSSQHAKFSKGQLGERNVTQHNIN